MPENESSGDVVSVDAERVEVGSDEVVDGVIVEDEITDEVVEDDVIDGEVVDDEAEAPIAYRDRNVEIHSRWVTAQQELEAAEEAGDSRAIKIAKSKVDAIGGEFINANRGLATSVAKSFFTPGDDSQQDYLSASFLGLWEAFLKWDPTKGVTFGTFSRTYIKGRTQRTVRAVEYNQISQTDFNRRTEVRNSQQKLARELGHTPSYEQVAADTKLPVTLVERALQPKAASLDTPVGDGERTLGDLLDEPETHGDLSEEQSAALEGLFHHLDETELWVMVQRYGLAGGPPQSLVEVADTIGIGREIARRTEKRAIEKLAVAASRASTD